MDSHTLIVASGRRCGKTARLDARLQAIRRKFAQGRYVFAATKDGNTIRFSRALANAPMPRTARTKYHKGRR